MISQNIIGNLGLYISHTVRLTLSENEYVDGELEVFDTETVTIDGKVYPISELVNLECLGTLLDFKTIEQRIIIDSCGTYDYPVDGALLEKLWQIRYQEYSCQLAFHLERSNDLWKIFPTDIRIISSEHVINNELLPRAEHIFALRDGTVLTGRLGSVLGDTCIIQCTDGTIRSCDRKQICDITKYPVINDRIIVVYKDESMHSGVVCAVKDQTINLIDADNKLISIELSNIAQLRFCGIITRVNGRLAYINSVICKLPLYLHSANDVTNVQEGAEVSFVAGINLRGVIAKDVIVISPVSGARATSQKTGIIVFVPNPNKPQGYIGEQFITKAYSAKTHSNMPHGAVAFSADQLDFQTVPQQYAYVVNYTCDDSLPLKAISITLREAIPTAEYGKIWVNEAGEIYKTHTSTLYIENFIDKSMEIVLNEGTTLVGKPKQVSGGLIVFQTDTDTLSIRPEEVNKVFFSGIVTGYQPSNGMGFINGQYWFHVNSFLDRNQVVDLSIGTVLKFTIVATSKGNLCQAVEICIPSGRSERKEGYVLFYENSRQYGFILPPDELEDHLRRNDHRGKIYFKGDCIKNPDKFNINTFTNYYRVSYLDTDGVKDVFFLEEKPYQLQKEDKQAKIETVSLAEYSVEGEEFGFLAISSNNFGRIVASYEPNYSGPYIEPVVFSPPKVSFSTGERPKNTSTTVYVVRFRREGTLTNPLDNTTYPTVADGSTITVIKEYKKKTVSKLTISGDKTHLICEFNGDKEASPPQNGTAPNRVPEAAIGENVLFETNGKFVFATCKERDETKIFVDETGTELGKVASSEGAVLRFGCVTGFDTQKSLGLINDLWSFSLGSMNSTLYNIVNAQASSMSGLTGVYCMFRCVGGTISEVLRIRDYLTAVPWKNGKIQEVKKDSPYIKIQGTNSSFIHRRSVERDPYVVPQIKRGGLSSGKVVWARVISIPWKTSKPQTVGLIPEAVDVHASEQQPVIRYQPATFQYLGFEHETDYYPVIASEAALRSAAGAPATVVFLPSTDKLTLEAHLKDDWGTTSEDDTDSTDWLDYDITSGDLSTLPLFRIYLSSVGLSQTGLKELRANENDLPFAEDASRIFDRLVAVNKYPDYPNQPKLQLVAAKIALAYPKLVRRDPSVKKQLLGVLRMDMRNKARQSDVVYGELAYGLSTLLKYDTKKRDGEAKKRGADYLTWLLLLTLGDSTEVKNYESDLKDCLTPELLLSRWGTEEEEARLSELLSHLLMLPAEAIERIGPMIDEHTQLALSLRDCCAAIDNNLKQCTNTAEMLGRLKKKVDKAFDEYALQLADACMRQAGKCTVTGVIIAEMSQRLLQFIDKDDRDRFVALKRACEKYENFADQGSFALQERELIDAWRIIEDLEAASNLHPCRRSTELLRCNRFLANDYAMFSALKDEIAQRLNRLYNSEAIPRLFCRVNEESLYINAFSENNGEYRATIRIIVQNGSAEQRLQPAEGIRIEIASLTPGITVTKEILLEKVLHAGEETSISAVIYASSQDVLESIDSIQLQYRIEFSYVASFQNGRSAQKKMVVEAKEPFVLQLASQIDEVKGTEKKNNPYDQAAKGDPLKADSKIYQRRIEEDVILNHIREIKPDGSEELRRGSTVMLYGQKKSGKTSLINQVKAYLMKNESLREKAIIVDFNSMLSNVGGIATIRRNVFLEFFCKYILKKFDVEVSRNHLDVLKMLFDKHVEIPSEGADVASAYFDFYSFFTTFNDLDEGKHTVVLFMDEFTTLCSSLVTEIQTLMSKAERQGISPDEAEINYLQHIPDFVKNFSDLGFIQIIIGHQTMLRSLDQLDMRNQTAEFANRIELGALHDDEATKLICEPMKDAFGYNPFKWYLGQKAVERMKRLSGRHPTFLVRICKEVFDYYTDSNRCPAVQTQLTDGDISKALEGYIAVLQVSDFNIILTEDGDSFVEEMKKRPSYRFLRCIANNCVEIAGVRSADCNLVMEKMSEELGKKAAETTHDILLARRIISYTNGGRLRIETELFIEYIKQRLGTEGGEY